MKNERNHAKGCLITLVILIAFLIYGVFVPEEGRNPTFAEDIGLTVIALVLVIVVVAIIRKINNRS